MKLGRNMKQTFDYLEHVAFAATVCDKDGVVLYQNALSLKREGNAVGKNLFNCHKEKSNEIIRHILETGEGNTYQIIRHGHRRMIQQTPWYEEPSGEVAGLVEIVLDLPDEYPTFDRDKKDYNIQK